MVNIHLYPGPNNRQTNILKESNKQRQSGFHTKKDKRQLDKKIVEREAEIQSQGWTLR